MARKARGREGFRATGCGYSDLHHGPAMPCERTSHRQRHWPLHALWRPWDLFYCNAEQVYDAVGMAELALQNNSYRDGSEIWN